MGDSAQVAPLAAAREGRTFSGLLRFQAWWVLLLGAWLYHSVLYNLVLQWYKDPNFQHGWFVPSFSLYLLWQDRQKLRETPFVPSWVGLAPLVIGLGLLILGQLGVEIYTSRFSFLLVLVGLILLISGRSFLRVVLFPVAFLVLMIPLPNLIQQRFTFPLQILASKLAAAMLELVNVPVLREGNVIHLATMPLNVAEACSGIRSLLSLVTLAIIYGYLMEKRNWVRAVLVCAAIPIAIFANSFRIFVTGLIVQYWDASKANGFFHEFQGWFLFVVSLSLLFAVHGFINLIWKGPPAAKEAPASAATRASQAAPSALPRRQWSPQFFAAALLMLATATFLWAHSNDEIFLARQPLNSLPMQIDGWTGQDNDPIDQTSLDILGNPEYVLRDYTSPSGQFPVNLFIAYYATQKAGETPHTPFHCIPGAGWALAQHRIISLKNSDGSTFPANRFVMVQGRQRALLVYWFEAQGQEVANEYLLKYDLVKNSIRLHRSDGALIRLITVMEDGESADAAQARMMQFGDHVLPMLGNYVP